MQKKLIAILFIFLILGVNQAKNDPSKQKCISYNKERIFDCIKKNLLASFQFQLITSLTSFICIKIGLWYVGFSSTGPVAGSIAAFFQSILGNVVAKSIFSLLQAAAMGKLSLIIIPSLTIGTLGSIVVLVFNCYNSDTCDLKEEQLQISSNQQNNQDSNSQVQLFQSPSFDINKYEKNQVVQMSEYTSLMPQSIVDIKKELQNKFTSIFPNFSNSLAELYEDASQFSNYVINTISEQVQNAEYQIKILSKQLANKIDGNIVGLSELVEFIWVNRESLQESFEFAFQTLKDQYQYFQMLQIKIDAMKYSIKEDSCMNSFLEYLDAA